MAASSRGNRYQQPGLCESYHTYGHCKFGHERCKKQHSQSPYKQKFSFATISTDRTERFFVRGVGGRGLEQFHIMPWYQDDISRVSPGDTVLFHSSSRLYENRIKYGRIAAVLPVSPVGNVALENFREDAFTIDQSGTKYRDDAITIEDCDEHSECKKIGIHVTATALEKSQKAEELPRYKKTPAAFWRRGFSLDRGKIIPALSVYVHTKDSGANGPVITPIKVAQHYTFSSGINDPEQMTLLWSHFVGDSLVDKITNSWADNYMIQFQGSWRSMILVNEMMTTFQNVVTKYIDRGGFPLCFVTKSSQLYVKQTIEDTNAVVTTFKDFCVDAKEAIRNNRQADVGEKILMATIFATQLQRWAKSTGNFFPRKYQADVEDASRIRQDSIVKSLAPLRTFQSHINQQILLRCMLGCTEQLYTRQDLLGMLSIRFRSPKITKPYVTALTKSKIILGYYAENPDTSLCELGFDIFPGKSLDSEVSPQTCSKRRLFFEDISCPNASDYCNRTLIHFDREKFEIFKQKMSDVGTILKEVQDHFIELIADLDEEEPTYRKQENGTLLTLQQGTEIQLQISKQDAEEGNGMGLRLLRMGKNCHLCLTHLNYPEKAFMSDRTDVREMINNERIIALKEARKAGALKSMRIQNRRMQWDGDYLSGGSFSMPKESGRVDGGDLLCIRKEEAQNDVLEYVWVCHGIVTGTRANSVEFSVCSLSQEEKTKSDDAGYCVEIIKSLPIKNCK